MFQPKPDFVVTGTSAPMDTKPSVSSFQFAISSIGESTTVLLLLKQASFNKRNAQLLA